MMRIGCLVVSLAVLAQAPAFGQPPAKKEAVIPTKVSYYRDVRPILQQHCQGCHQLAKPLGGFVMTSYADLLKPGDQGNPGVVPGKPDKSFIVEQIHVKDGQADMPKGKDPLPDFQVKIITNWIAQGAADDTPASANASLVDQEHPPVYKLPPVISALAFSPDGKLLAVSGYHEVLLHKADGSGLLGRLVGLSERVQSLAFSPDGKTLAVAGGDPGRFGEIQLWDVAKQRLKLSVPVTFDTVYGVSWSPDGSKVAFGCADNTIRAIDATTGKQVLYQGAHADWVMGTVFSQDGEHLVSVSRDRSVKLTHVETQRFIDNVTSITPGALKGGLLALDRRPVHGTPKRAKVPPDAPGAVARVADQLMFGSVSLGVGKVYDELMVAGADGIPRLYKMHRESKRVIGDDANRIREYEPMPGRIYSVAFSADGTRFAAGSSLDGAGEVRVYEVDSGKRVATGEGVKGGVYAVAFRPDGKVVASAGFDGTVRLHDAATGKLVKEFLPVPMGK